MGDHQGLEHRSRLRIPRRGRIGGSIDYYITHTGDLLYMKSAPATSVFTSVLSNVGKTKGSGIEVSLNAVPVRTKDFEWTIDASYSHAQDEVSELADGLQRNILGYNKTLIRRAYLDLLRL